MQIINGTKLAKQHEENLRARLLAFQNKICEAKPGISLRNPGFVSLYNGQDEASKNYTSAKFRKAIQLGMSFLAVECSSLNTPEELIDAVLTFNDDPTKDVVMLQLPLPPQFNIFQGEILNNIDPDKDGDGLTEEGRKIYLPATVKSVISILEECVSGWKEMKIGVAGAAGSVGRLLVNALYNRAPEASIIRVDQRIEDTYIKTDLKECDLVVSTIGRKHIITREMLKSGVVLIDVGLGGSGKQEGDFDPNVYSIARMWTPPKGGVGPMTVISLMENGVDAYMRHMIRQYDLPEDFSLSSI